MFRRLMAASLFLLVVASGSTSAQAVPTYACFTANRGLPMHIRIEWPNGRYRYYYVRPYGARWIYIGPGYAYWCWSRHQPNLYRGCDPPRRINKKYRYRGCP